MDMNRTHVTEQKTKLANEIQDKYTNHNGNDQNRGEAAANTPEVLCGC